MWTLACCGVRKHTLFILSLLLSFSSAVRPYKEGLSLVVFSLQCCFIHISKILTRLKLSLCDWRFYCVAQCHKDLVFESLICPLVHVNISVSVEMSGRALWHQYSSLFRFNALGSKSNSLKWPISHSPVLSSFFSKLSSAFLHMAVLDVYVLSTDGQVQDFKFPQSSKDGISIQLSANTVKLNSRNGKLS